MICCFPSNFSSSKVFKGPTKGQFACELCDSYAGVWCDFFSGNNNGKHMLCCFKMANKYCVGFKKHKLVKSIRKKKKTWFHTKKGTNRNWRTDWHWAKKHEDKPQTKIGKIHNKQRHFIFYNILQTSKYTYTYYLYIYMILYNDQINMYIEIYGRTHCLSW